MPTPAKRPTTTPIPVQLSATEFHEFILSHLSMPKRGPKCKLGYHRLFNLIVWVLYTGMQWKCLPVPKDTDGKPAIHYTTVYKVFARWSDDGSLAQAFIASVRHLADHHSSISASCMAMAPTRWPKKAGTASAIPATNTSRGKRSSRLLTTTATCWLLFRGHRGTKPIRGCYPRASRRPHGWPSAQAWSWKVPLST